MNTANYFFILVLISTHSIAQEYDLYVPKEIKTAYNNGTRSWDGNPGKNYWQNTADYDIDVVITPKTRDVSGTETIMYYNNSPDDLSRIVIRLYYDVFKTGNERGMQVNPADIGDGVELSEVKVNGNNWDLSNPKMARRSGTNLSIYLDTPLQSGNSITLEFKWKQKVPLTVRRTGAKDSTSFFIAYWYPQVAVYDDIFGWDMINYTFDTEFYNNLSNFNVKITAPENFVVWATGEIQNAEDLFQQKYLDRYNEAKKSLETISIIDSLDLNDLKLKSGTWHYKASNVTDFTFAMSDHYMWDAATQFVDGRNVLISSGYPREKKSAYQNLTTIQQKAMKHFSEDVPGVPYPYPEFTTFIGLNGGGMESPMMANNANPGQGVTIHEMYHTYFPMYVRVNERRWAWMDEGWADFVTALVSHKYFKDENDKSTLYSSFKFGMQGTSGSIGDLPTVTSSQYMGDNYGYHSYSLPSFTYSLLYNYLGEELFLKCYSEYIKRWALKSPTPYDYFNTFEDVSGEDLNWLWEPWYFQFGEVELELLNYEKGIATIKNSGRRPVPISLKVNYKDGKEVYLMENAKVWQNASTFEIKVPNHKNVESLALSTDMIDSNELNNYSPSLNEIYKKAKSNAEVLGLYTIQGYPITAEIIEENEIFKLELTNTNISAYLMPISSTEYESLDKNIKLNFIEKDGKISSISIELKAFGVTLTGEK